MIRGLVTWIGLKIRQLLVWLGFNRCSRCGYWARRGRWAYVSQTVGPPPRVICWECREFEMYTGFSP